MRKYKSFIGLVIIAFVLAGVITTVNVGKAQQAKTEIAELTDLANALDGNVEAFKLGVAFLAGNIQDGVLGVFGASAIRDSDNLSNKRPGTVVSYENIFVENDVEIDGTLYADGVTVVNKLVTGGLVNVTTTDAAAYTLVAADLSEYNYLDVENGIAATWTLPATSTMIGFLPDIGSTREWIFKNATTSGEATSFTFAAGAGMDFVTASSSVSLVLDAGDYAKITCTQIVYRDVDNENIMCSINRLFDVD